MKKHLWTVIVIIVSIFLFYKLTWDIRPFPINAGVDDAKYAKDALEIASGNWLGAYDNLTLTKRPFFGLVQALRIHLGIPYTGFEFGFHIFCMLGFLWALVNLGFNRYFSLFAYFLILFMPQFYDFQANRVSRDLFNNDLQILIFSLSFVLAFVQDKIAGSRRKLFLILSLCFLLALHYGTREESFLIWPGLLVLLVGHVRHCGAKLLLEKWRYGMTLFLIFLSVIMTAKFLWQLKNYSKYGLFITMEHEQGSFAKAVGALASIREELGPSRLLIDQNERVKLAELSPVFARIKLLLENPHDDSTEKCQKERICEGFDYSHQIFAFRDSLPEMGVGKNALAAENFYSEFANEIEEHCKSGKLKCNLPLRATLLPKISWQIVPRFVEILGQHLLEVFNSVVVSFEYREGVFSKEDQDKFEKMTLQKVFLLKDKKLVLGELPTSLETVARQISMRQRVAAVYSIFSNIFFILGIIIFFLGLVLRLFKTSFIRYILAATLITIILRILAISFIGSVDSKMANAYVFPVYPMVMWFFLIVIYEVVQQLRFKHPHW